MAPQITTMNELNIKLFSLLGSPELVHKWWFSPNKAFDNRTPKEVFVNDKDGPEKIENYINFFCSGNYS